VIEHVRTRLFDTVTTAADSNDGDKTPTEHEQEEEHEQKTRNPYLGWRKI
jgi:hypothetical protein